MVAIIDPPVFQFSLSPLILSMILTSWGHLLSERTSEVFLRQLGKICDTGTNKAILGVDFVLLFSASPPPPDKNLCESSGICSDLYLFDAHDRRLRIVQGTQDKIFLGPVDNFYYYVVYVQTRGSGGCYTIFEEEHFKGEHFCWTGDEKQNLNHQSIYSSTVVRYNSHF